MTEISLKILFSSNYDIKFWGLQNLHPFDSCKYGHVWNELQRRFGRDLEKMNLTEQIYLSPERQVSFNELNSVHSAEYLNQSLKSPSYLAKALELLPLALLPYKIIDETVLRPMRFATMGTIKAAEEALKYGASVNLSGGYHHAGKQRGEGFCIYSDVAVAIQQLRISNRIDSEDRVCIIDLDAHQGNGLSRIFYEDDCVNIFDMYNRDIYPQDRWAAKRNKNYNIPISSGTEDFDYLELLRDNLPGFLEELNHPKIVFYNAGTDVYCGDPLGSLAVTERGILERDRFVFGLLKKLKIPFVMVLSGGYTRQSYKLVADSVGYLIEDLVLKNF